MKYSSLIASALCLGAFCNDVTIYSHENIIVHQTPDIIPLDTMHYWQQDRVPEVPPNFGQVQGVITVSPNPTPPQVIVLPPRELNGDEYVGIAQKWKAEAEQWKKDHPQ